MVGDRQKADEASLSDPDHPTIAISFSNDDQAIAPTETGVVLCDRPHWNYLQDKELN